MNKKGTNTTKKRYLILFFYVNIDNKPPYGMLQYSLIAAILWMFFKIKKY